MPLRYYTPEKMAVDFRLGPISKLFCIPPARKTPLPAVAHPGSTAQGINKAMILALCRPDPPQNLPSPWWKPYAIPSCNSWQNLVIWLATR